MLQRTVLLFLLLSLPAAAEQGISFTPLEVGNTWKYRSYDYINIQTSYDTTFTTIHLDNSATYGDTVWYYFISEVSTISRVDSQMVQHDTTQYDTGFEVHDSLSLLISITNGNIFHSRSTLPLDSNMLEYTDSLYFKDGKYELYRNIVPLGISQFGSYLHITYREGVGMIFRESKNQEGGTVFKHYIELVSFSNASSAIVLKSPERSITTQRFTTKPARTLALPHLSIIQGGRIYDLLGRTGTVYPKSRQSHPATMSTGRELKQ